MAGLNALAAARLFVSAATAIESPGVALFTSVLSGGAGPVAGIALMLQAPRAARRWGRFVLRSLIGSIAAVEIGNVLPSQLGEVVPGLLVGIALSSC